MFIDADHRAAGRQAKRQCGLFAHRTGDELCRLEADLFVIAFQDDQHAASSLKPAFESVETMMEREKK
jgi:hypothetical protein